MFKPDNSSPRSSVETACVVRRRRLEFPLVLAAAFVSAMLAGPVILANPTGGVVVRGSADIKTYPERVTVQQHSDKTVINWNGFNIEGGEVTRFKQPGKDSIALNRVITNQPSRIDGLLRANGNVWLVNQNGVTIGPGGKVRAQGFLATTSDIADNDFMDGDGRYNFRPSTNHNPNARVVNQGRISVGERGLGALVAPHARNDHLIQGKGSTVVIGGAKTFAVDFYGDGLIHFDTGSPVTQRPEGVDALAENNGMIRVEGGQVLITADAAADIIDKVIKVGGKVQARSAYSDGGEIVLDGGRSGTVAVTGTLDVSSKHPKSRGGKIDMRGHRIELGPKALVTARGKAGGGDIRIGGDRQGKGPGPNADAVVLAPEARIIADATVAGDGGSIIVYGEQTAVIDGILTAQGGPKGGDGGFIETSAAGTIEIAADVLVDASAPAGEPGLWLIDPRDITIDPILADIIVSALEDGNNVGISTSSTSTPQSVEDQLTPLSPDPGQPGNITVAASIQPNLAAATGDQVVTLKLTADNNVAINPGITIGPASAGNEDGNRDSMGVTIGAKGSITNNGAIDVSAGAGGNVSLTAASNVALGRIRGGTINVTATGGAISDATGDEGANLTGGAINLVAATGIGVTGAATDIDTTAGSINAQTTSGGIYIRETDTVTLGTVTTGTGGGSIEVTADGNIVSQTVTTTGSARLTAGSNVALGRIRGGTINVTATGGAISDNTADENANLIGGTINLVAATGIGATGAADIDTNVVSLDAQASSGNIFIEEISDIALGRVVASSGGIALTAGGAITDKDPTSEGVNKENLVGGAISLTTGGAIGGSGNADIDTKAVSVSASTNTGDIFIAETDGVTLGTVATGSGGGSIEVTAGGNMTVAQTITTTGSARLTAGSNVALGRIQGGTINVTATGGAISDATGDEGANLTGGAINLVAATDIGATGAADINTTAGSINAQTTSGGIYIRETDTVTLGTVTTGTGGGSIEVTAGGNMTVAQTITTTGSARLTAGSNVALGRIQGGTINVTATGGAISDATGDEGANLTGGAINLVAATDIGATGAADINTTAGSINAQTTSGGIYIRETDTVTLGTVTTGTGGGSIEVTAGGNMTVAQTITTTGSARLTAGSNVALGRIQGGTINVTATGGAISDATGDEGANLTGGAINLVAATDIGATGAADINTTAGSINAQTTSGGIYIRETDTVTLGTVTTGTGGGSIEVTAGGNMTVAQTITTTGSARLTAGSNVALGRIQGGTINVTATGGAISDATGDEGANLTGGAINLVAATGIGATGAADINTTAGSINAQTTSGSIYIRETDTVTLGTVTTGTGGGSIEVTAGGNMTVAQNVTTKKKGEIRLQATNSNLTVNTDVKVESENGKIRLATGSGTLTLEDAGGASPTRSVIRTGNADIELAVNDLVIENNDLTKTPQILAGGDKEIVFLPTVGRSIGLGGGAGEFRLDDNEIAALETAGFVRFGADAERVGEVRIDTADFSKVGGLEIFSDGSISDSGAANESATDQLQAKILRLNAKTGIGDKDNPLNTHVDSLDAQTSSGSIFIDETDGVALGRVDAGTQAIDLTAGGAITDQDATSEGAGNENLVGGAIKLTATSGDIGAAGDAAIDMAATGLDAQTSSGSIFIDETDGVALGRVDAGTQAIDLTAGGAITDQDATSEGAGNENLVGGAIKLIATGGDIGAAGDAAIDTAAIGLDAQTNSGSIFIDETDGVALGRVDAGTQAIDLTAGGAITDQDATSEGAGNENLVGGAIKLTATSGDIGAAAGADLDTKADSLDAQATSGDIFIDETDGIALGRVVAGTDTDRKNVTLTAGGAITDDTSGEGMGSENLIGSTIRLTAGGAIGGNGDADLDTKADSLDAQATSGDIFIDETDGIALGRVEAGSGDISLKAGGAITDQDATSEGAGNENLVGGAIKLITTSGDIGAAGDAAIDTAATGLDAQTSSGSIFIDETDDVALGRVDAGTQAIDLTAGGAITDKDPTSEGADNENLIGGTVRLTATSGIGAAGNADIDTAAEKIDAKITGISGGIFIDETDEVQLGDLTAPGAIEVTTGKSLQVNQAVRAGGNVTLTGGTGIEHTNAGDVTAGGALTATATSGDIGMAGGTLYKVAGSTTLRAQRDVELGRIEAGTNSIMVTAEKGAIGDNTTAEGAGSENLVGGDIKLTAATGIGAAGEAADVDTAADTIDAATGSGGIYLAETDVVQLGNTASVTTGSGGGAIQVDAGGAMTIAQNVVTAGSGAISQTTKAGNLQIDQAVTAGGELGLESADLLSLAAAISGGGDVTLTGGAGIGHTAAGDVTAGGAITATARNNDIIMADGTLYKAGGSTTLRAQGNVALSRIEAGSNPITVVATGGKISDNTAAEGAGNENLVGGDIKLTAATGIGAEGETADVDTAANTIDAATGSGGIYLAETDVVRLGNTASVTTGSGGGAIQVDAGGAMTVGQAITTKGSGAISLTTKVGKLQINQAVTAGGELDLESADLLNLAAAVEGGSSVNLTGGAGIGHTAAGDVTAGGAITATAKNNDIGMADGTLYQAGGSTTLRAQRDVNLGRIEVGTNPITVTAEKGAISDNTVVEGAGNENLVGGDIKLTAATGIGAEGEAADIDTAANTIDVATESGGIYLAETDGVQLGNTASVTTGSGGGAIEVTAGGAMTIAQNVVTAGSGAINLTTTANDLQVNAGVTAGGELNLEAANLLSLAAATSGGSDITLTGGTGIGHTAAGNVTSGGAITATATSGDIGMADGTLYKAERGTTLRAQRDVKLGRIETGTNPILVTVEKGAISDNTVVEGAGNENLVGGDIKLIAATGIGAEGEAADIDTAANTIDAATESGGIYLAETDGMQLGNTASVTTGSGGGPIEVTAGGAMTIAQNVVTAGSGAINLTTTANDLQVNAGVTAGGELNLEAANLLSLAAATSGGSDITLTGGTGIGHTAAGNVTSGGAITATATSGDIGMADGTLYKAERGTTLRAQGNVALGRIETGTDPILVTAEKGAISDNTTAEGKDNENLVGGDLELTAATGIGAEGETADIDTAVEKVDAQTTGGSIFIAEKDNLGLGRVDAGTNAIAITTGGAITDADSEVKNGREVENLVGGDLELTAATGIGAPGETADIDTAAGTINARTTRSGGIHLAETDAVILASKIGIEAAAGADIKITAGSEMTVGTGGVRTASNGDILLRTTFGDLVIGGLVETGSGDLALSAGGSIRQGSDGLLRTTTHNQGTHCKDTTQKGGTLALLSGGAIGKAGTPDEPGAIRIDVGTVAAKAENGGVFLKQESSLRIGTSAGANPLTGITATGNIEVTTVGSDSNLLICEKIESGKKGSIDLEVGGRIIAENEHLRGFRYQETIDSTLQLTRSFFDNLAEAYAIPEYALDEELNLVYLSGANEAIWGWNKTYDDEEEGEEEDEEE